MGIGRLIVLPLLGGERGARSADRAALAASGAGRGDRRRGLRARRIRDRPQPSRASTACAAPTAIAPPPSDPRPASRLWPGGGRDHLAAGRRADLLRHPALAAGLERPLGGIVGGRSSASPPGPSSRSASPRTASRDAPMPSWSISAPARATTDYQGKEVRGRLVLTSSQPGAVQDLAVGRHGAAGIISWAQNQRTGWWGEDESLVRWGHLETFSEHPTFAFMVSPARARGWQERLRRGESGAAARRGRCRAKPERLSDPDRDHPRPAARPGDRLFLPSRPSQSRRQRQCLGLRRDPRSGAHAEPPDPRAAPCRGPERTIRFIWPPEVEGTIALLNARPNLRPADAGDDPSRHDRRQYRDHQVGAARPRLATEPAELRLRGRLRLRPLSSTRSPCSMPTPAAPISRLLEPDGDRRALQAEIGGFNEGSDHEVWAEGSWRIPVIYIADWPDRYIHTQRDLARQSRSDQDAPRHLHRRRGRLASGDRGLVRDRQASAAGRDAVGPRLPPHSPRRADERLRL